MTNLFTLRSKFFWPAMAVCLLPFVILAFLDSMAMDDYYFYDLFRARGFWGAQHDLYLTWAGRYTTSFITGIFISLDLPARSPFLPTLCYFAFTWIAIVYMLRSLRPLLPAGFFGRGGVWKAAAVLFILFLYVQVDIATGFYWLSSTSVYQTAFILFLLLVGTIVRRISVHRSFAPVDLLFFLLVVLLVGCNEIMAVFLPLFLAALAGFFYMYRRRIDRWLWLGLAIAIGMGLVVFFTSGVMNYRHHLMNARTGFVTILPVIGFRTIEVLFYILKEPLFWGCTIAIFVGGIAVSPQLKEGPLTIFRTRNVFLPAVVAPISIVCLALAAFLFASRGSIPPRALNNLGDMTACCLLALLFLAAIHTGARWTTANLPKPSPLVQLALLVAFLMTSVNYAEAWRSVGSGYLYHAVVADRDQALKTAAAGHRHVAIVPSYDAALTEKIDRFFPHGISATAREWLLQKPTLLVVYDGAAVGDAAYAHFYGLDTVIVGPDDRRPKARH